MKKMFSFFMVLCFSLTLCGCSIQNKIDELILKNYFRDYNPTCELNDTCKELNSLELGALERLLEKSMNGDEEAIDILFNIYNKY
ncbi:MAG: hypothetical protein ACLSXM_05450 [Turicibacter sanguinis]